MENEKSKKNPPKFIIWEARLVLHGFHRGGNAQNKWSHSLEFYWHQTK